jgi:hypothetical protein
MRVWIILLKVFGYVWLTAAGLLILAGAAESWREGGFSAVQNIVDLFWAVITLAPGLGALAWAEKLKAKGHVGPNKRAQLFQGDRARARQSWEAKNLVFLYGAILERKRELIISEELLPTSKQEIKQALIAVARAARSTGHISAEMMEHLRTGYACLADFVSHEEAEIMKHYYSLMQTGTEMKDSSDARVLEIAKELADHRYVEIQRRVYGEFVRLMQEYNAAITA